MGFYGQVEGMSKPLSYHHETALISGRLTYSFANARLFGAVGKLPMILMVALSIRILAIPTR